MRILVALVVVTGCGAASRASSPPPVIPADAVATPVRVPYGIADDAGRLFLVRADGHIDALDARTGMSSWTSPDAAMPLVGVDGGVIALVVQRVAFFDRAGQRMWWSERIPLGTSRWSTIEATNVDHGTLHATLLTTSGGGGVSECMEFVVGTADIDLRTGKVTTAFVPSRSQQPRRCRDQPPATITLDGAPLVLTAQSTGAPIYSGDGREWMEMQLAATRDTGVVWTHPLPREDVTPYQ